MVPERIDKVPCYGCMKKCVTLEYNCHSNCQEYLDWKAWQEYVRECRHFERAICRVPGASRNVRFPYNLKRKRQRK